jgi:hypothetical protein
MGAWASLILAQRLDINEMLLLGDSKVIIDWLNGKTDLQVAALECWKERTLEASRHIKSLSFSHIYREDNRDARHHVKKGVVNAPWSFKIFSVGGRQRGPPFLAESMKKWLQKISF